MTTKSMLQRVDRSDEPLLYVPPELFLNRELSWLAFNQRVLEEAEDTCNLQPATAQISRQGMPCLC